MQTFTLDSDPKAVLEYHRPALIPIYEALEIAAPKAILIISENGWRNTGTLSSHLMRAEMLALLDGKILPVEYDDVPRILSMDSIAMEGLSTFFDGVEIKILKGSTFPVASSDAREIFYQQSLPSIWDKTGAPPIKSLLITWDCDPEGNNLRLYLYCPKSATDYAWRETIPSPPEWMIVPPNNNRGSNGGGDLGDLVAITKTQGE
jgi:hypothetical protein